MKTIAFVAAALSLLGSSPALEAQDELGKRERKRIEVDWARYDSAKSFVIEHEKVIPTSTVKQVAEALDEVLTQYIQVFKHKPSEKLKVQFLDSPNTYEQLGGLPSTAGHYSPQSDCLYLKQLPFYELIPTAYHEAFHQYLQHYVGKDVEIPLWFNEGMAEYYEGIQRNKETKKLDYKLIDNRKLRMVRDKFATRTAIPLEKLLNAGYDQFHDKSDKHREELHYNQSFGLVYFFMQAKGGRPILQFTEELRKSKNLKAANEKLFGKDMKNVKSLETQWKQFVAQVKLEEKK